MTNHCPVCRRAWDYASEGINVPGHPRSALGYGRLVPVHPVGKCVAPPPVVYEPDADEVAVNPRRPDGKVRRGYMAEPEERICDCGKWFWTHLNTRKSCSDVCSERRNRAKQREHWRRSYHRRKARAA